MFQTVNNKTMLTDMSYSVGKKLVQIWIPAFSALYFGLSKIWGLPASEEIVGTCAIVAVFLGTVLGISSAKYDASDAAHDGQIVVGMNPNTGNTVYDVQPDVDPKEWAKQGSISLKIVHQDPTQPVPESPLPPEK